MAERYKRIMLIIKKEKPAILNGQPEMRIARMIRQNIWPDLNAPFASLVGMWNFWQSQKWKDDREEKMGDGNTRNVTTLVFLEKSS